jgi:hypothetical protein
MWLLFRSPLTSFADDISSSAHALGIAARLQSIPRPDFDRPDPTLSNRSRRPADMSFARHSSIGDIRQSACSSIAVLLMTYEWRFDCT